MTSCPIWMVTRRKNIEISRLNVKKEGMKFKGKCPCITCKTQIQVKSGKVSKGHHKDCSGCGKTWKVVDVGRTYVTIALATNAAVISQLS